MVYIIWRVSPGVFPLEAGPTRTIIGYQTTREKAAANVAYLTAHARGGVTYEYTEYSR